jgi:hypothetical protein
VWRSVWCNHVVTTALQAVIILSLQALNRMTFQAVSDVAGLLNVLLPLPNTTPSIAQLRHLSQATTEDAMAIPMCVNECVLFINAPLVADPQLDRQFEQCTHCPICDEAKLSNGKPRHVRQFSERTQTRSR